MGGLLIFMSKKGLNGPTSLYWRVTQKTGSPIKKSVEYNTVDGKFLSDYEAGKLSGHNRSYVYLITLLDDSNDFSWQAAKSSHAVLC